MYEYLVYLMKNGQYVECVRCNSQDEADIIIDTEQKEGNYEKYLLIIRDKILNQPVGMETDYFSVLTHNRKGR